MRERLFLTPFLQLIRLTVERFVKRRDVPFLEPGVCICGNAILGAIVSSYHSRPHSYLCMLEAPRIGSPHEEKEIIECNNVIALLRPKAYNRPYILVGCHVTRLRFTGQSEENRKYLAASLVAGYREWQGQEKQNRNPHVTEAIKSAKMAMVYYLQKLFGRSI